MKHLLARMGTLVIASSLAASCANLGGLSGSTGNDAGTRDGTVACGGVGESCCNGNACDLGSTCGGGVCLRCGSAGEPCCNGATCANGLSCGAGGLCAASSSSSGSTSATSSGHVGTSTTGTTSTTATTSAARTETSRGSTASASSSSGVDAGCTPGAQQCSDGSHVETCDASGAWGDVWLCATGACSGGSCTGTATAAPPSCAVAGAGMTTCPAGTGSQSCCASLEVPGGAFFRTYTNVGSGATAEADPATVSGLRIDQYLVTVGRFRQFVAAWNSGGGPPPPSSGKHMHLNDGQGLANSGAPGTFETGWLATDDGNIAPTDANLACDPEDAGAKFATWTRSAGDQENLPINCVNWWEAYAFCIWDGGFLPSEAEWEYTAAGGSQEREYAWGSMAPGTACPGTGCEYAIYNCDYPSGGGTCTGVANLAPVGSAPLGVGTWGQLDMAGDVFEWNVDWYAAYADPCTDCAYLSSTATRAMRGGIFLSPAPRLVASYRYKYTPQNRNSYVGFRCARAP